MLAKNERLRRAALICETAGGIHPPNEIYYLSHIEHTSRFCLRAFANFEMLLAEPTHLNKADAAFEALQLGLSHAAAISRFFWSSRNGLAGLSASRALKLRHAFAVDDTSPLRDRSLRDAIEHYDERLDEYLLDPRYGNIVAVSIGVDAQTWTASAFSLQHINIVAGEVELLGKRYRYQPIKIEVHRLMFAAEKFMANGCRLPTAT